MIHSMPVLSAPRVGVDLVSVADVRDSLGAFGARFLTRIFTPRELRDVTGTSGAPDVERLAARYAAKEAVLKVLRPDRHWYNWQQIEILSDSGGWVTLELHGAAEARAAAEGLHHFTVSLSHEKDFAIATVLGSA